MKRILTTIVVSFLTVLTFSSFELNDKNRVLLVLKNVLNQEKFSMFKVYQDKNGVIIAKNVDEYPVETGLYRIEGSSNDKLYHKKVMVVNN